MSRSACTRRRRCRGGRRRRAPVRPRLRPWLHSASVRRSSSSLASPPLHGGVSGPVLMLPFDPSIDVFTPETPGVADLERWQLAALRHPIHRALVDAQVLGHLSDRPRRDWRIAHDWNALIIGWRYSTRSDIT